MPKIRQVSGSVALRGRLYHEQSAVDNTAWTWSEFTVPTEGIIHRVRVVQQNKADELEVMVMEKDPDDEMPLADEDHPPLSVILKYASSAGQLDSEEFTYFKVPQDSDLTDGEGADMKRHGSLFVGLKSNNGAAQPVKILIDFEVVA